MIQVNEPGRPNRRHRDRERQKPVWDRVMGRAILAISGSAAALLPRPFGHYRPGARGFLA